MASRQSTRKFKGLAPNLQACGGIPDCLVITDAAISASGTTLTSASNPFSANRVGNVVCVNGAGAAGAALVTTIASFTSAGSVKVTAAASTTVTGAVAVFGTDNKAAFAAFRSTCMSAKRKYWIPSGVYLTTDPTEFEGASIEIVGEAKDNVASSVIVYVGTGAAVHIHPPVGTYYCYAANMHKVAVACFGGAASAIKCENLSQADFVKVGINQEYGAHSTVGWDLINPNILKFERPITQLCGTAFKVSSTGFPDSATNLHIHGGNIYENDTVFDFQANVVALTVDGLCHFEHFTDFMKCNRTVGAVDLQINSLTVDNCEITASTGGYTSKLINFTVPGVTTLIAKTIRFTNNWVFFGSAADNPFYFDVAGTAAAEIDLIVESNDFGNIDTSLIHAPATGINVFYGKNSKRFGSDFTPLSVGSTATLYAPVYGGDALTTANRVPFVSAPQKLSADAGLAYYGTAGSKTFEVVSDNATDGQFRVGVGGASRVLAISIPTSAYTAVVKLLGALGAVAVNGSMTVGSDEQPTVTLFVHNNTAGGHTQLQVKGNAADGALNAIVNILTSASAAAMQILGNGVVLLPLVSAGRPARIGGSGEITTGPTSVTSSTDVDVSGLTDGALVKRSGSVLASATAFTASRMVVTDGSGNLVAHTAQTASRPMATASDGLPTTTSYTDIYNNIKPDIDADFVSVTELTTNVYNKSEVDGLIADLQSQIDAKVSDVVYSAHTHTIGDHTHGGVTTGGDSTASAGAGSTSGP